jgi:hypothetical protein
MFSVRSSMKKNKTTSAEEQQRNSGRLDVAAHEAGHAVVAAYLRIRFRYVTIQKDEQRRIEGKVIGTPYRARTFSYSSRQDAFRRHSEAEIDLEMRRQLTKRAIFVLGSRAAMDSLVGEWFQVADDEVIEQTFEGDEAMLTQIAEELKMSEFGAWREKLLRRAREIVAIPYVQQTIRDVAYDLVLHTVRSSKQVRDVLILNRQLDWRQGDEAGDKGREKRSMLICKTED